MTSRGFCFLRNWISLQASFQVLREGFDLAQFRQPPRLPHWTGPRTGPGKARKPRWPRHGPDSGRGMRGSVGIRTCQWQCCRCSLVRPVRSGPKTMATCWSGVQAPAAAAAIARGSRDPIEPSRRPGAGRHAQVKGLKGRAQPIGSEGRSPTSRPAPRARCRASSAEIGLDSPPGPAGPGPCSS